MNASPACHAWFPLHAGGCGDLVTHRVLLTLKAGIGAPVGFLLPPSVLLLPGAGQVQLPASPPSATGKGDSL